MKSLKYIVLLFIYLTLSACGPASNSIDTSTNLDESSISEASFPLSNKGLLTVRLTDAPVDEAAEVNISIAGISLNRQRGEDPSDEEGWTDYPFDSTPPQVDLLELQSGISFDLLENEEIVEGTYKVRLNINFDEYTEDELIEDPDKSNPPNNIVIDGENVAGGIYELTIPSGQQTGLKLNTAIQVFAGSCADYTIDFDLRRSVVLRGNQRNNNGYLLKPVLRVVDNANAVTITGKIPAENELPAGCVIADGDGDGKADNISAYIFEGGVEPDDYDEKDAEAVTTVPVDFTGIFETAPLPGNSDYTVAFTCEANLDDLETDQTDLNGPQMTFTELVLQADLQVDVSPGHYLLEPVETSCAVDSEAPTAVLSVRDIDGQTLTNNQVPFGEDFILDGSSSIDVGGGEIAEYIWNRVGIGGFEVKTNVPTVNASIILQGQDLPLGVHSFSLEVVDNSGNKSTPALLNVIVVDSEAPTAVLSVRDIDGQTLTNNQVPFGEDFILDGSSSIDVGGGEIAEYIWNRVGIGGFEVKTNVPTVNASIILQGQDLPLGVHSFSLEVVDNSGNKSTPALLNVIVVDSEAPTAVLSVRDIDGQTLTNNQVPFGEDFILDGSSSIDVGGGEIAEYIWNRVGIGGFEVKTNVPTVNASIILQGQDLPLGVHSFSLEVVDNSGNKSTPVQVSVTVIEP